MKNQLQLYLNRFCIIATLILFATCSPKKEYKSVKIEYLTFQYEREGVDTSFLQNFKVDYGLNEGFFGYYNFFYELKTIVPVNSDIPYFAIQYGRFKYRTAYPDSNISYLLLVNQNFNPINGRPFTFHIVNPNKKYIVKNSKNLVRAYYFINENSLAMINVRGDSLEKYPALKKFNNFLTHDVVNIQVDTNKIKYVNTYNPNAKNGKNK